MPVAMIRIVHVDTVGCYVKAHRRILGFEGKPSSVIVVTHGFNIPRETSFSHVAPWPFSIVSTSVPWKCFNRMEGVFVIHHSWKFQPRQRSIGIDTGAPIWPSWEHRIMCVWRYIEIETIRTKLVPCVELESHLVFLSFLVTSLSFVLRSSCSFTTLYSCLVAWINILSCNWRLPQFSNAFLCLCSMQRWHV
jgi:hypothetical protein